MKDTNSASRVTKNKNYAIKTKLPGRYYIKNLYKAIIKLERKPVIRSVLEAQEIYTWCMEQRKTDLSNLRTNNRKVEEKAEVALTLVANCPESIVNKRMEALCGFSKHVPSSEPYFFEAIYKSNYIMKKTTSKICEPVVLGANETKYCELTNDSTEFEDHHYDIPSR